MDNLLGIEPIHGRIDFSIDDERMTEGPRRDGEASTRSAMFFLDGHPGTTHVSIAHYPPGHEEPPHSHATDYMAVILRGEYEVGRRVYRAGDIRIQEAGSVYGPSRVGPDGCTQLVVFANPAGLVLDLPRERDRTSGQYDELNEWLRRLGAGERIPPPNTTSASNKGQSVS